MKHFSLMLLFMKGLRGATGFPGTVNNSSQELLNEALICLVGPALLFDGLLSAVLQAAHFLHQLPQARHLRFMELFAKKYKIYLKKLSNKAWVCYGICADLLALYFLQYCYSHFILRQ